MNQLSTGGDAMTPQAQHAVATIETFPVESCSPCRVPDACAAPQRLEVEVVEEQQKPRSRVVWWLGGGGALALAWYAIASGKVDTLIYMLHCALAG
jgi:hypothetical protein